MLELRDRLMGTVEIQLMTNAAIVVEALRNAMSRVARSPVRRLIAQVVGLFLLGLAHLKAVAESFGCR